MDFGRILKIKDEDGNVKRFEGYVTQDLTLKKGDKFYLNDIEESYAKKVEHNIISQDEANERLEATRARDEQYNRETKYVCRLKKNTNNGTTKQSL